MEKFCPFLIFLLLAGTVFSAPFNGQIKTFKQPDGNEVQVKLFGDEYYLRAESLDGYTLIKDEQTGWICYARLSADSSILLSNGTIYQGETNTSLTTNRNAKEMFKHLDISTNSRLQIVEQNRQRLQLQVSETILTNKTIGVNEPAPTNQPAPPPTVNGKIKGLTIIIDFSDATCKLPLTEYENLWNNMNYSNYGNNGSIKKYYSDISGGLLEYDNMVYGVFRAPKTFAAYDQMDYAAGAKEILGLALNWIKAQGFNFSTLTTDANKNILAINIMYTGSPKSWAQGMWHHQGTYRNFTANGVKSNSYNCSGADAPLSIGSACHENGHMLYNWPDTYKYETTTGVDGIGNFDIMCAIGDETNPNLPNPYFILNAGWATVTSVNGFNGTKSDISNDISFFKYSNPANAKEYYLFQSVIKTGRGKKYPDQGLTIWHIDEAGDNQTTHHQVYLMHANNNISVHQAACWKSTYKTEFNDATTPSAKWYNGSNSGLKCYEISNYGTSMTYKFGTPIAVVLDCAGVENGSAATDDCERCVGGSTGKTACTMSVQAEDACSYEGTMDNNYAGFKGTGFLNTPNTTGTGATFSLNASVAGSYVIGFRYAGSSARAANLLLNNEQTGYLVFSSTNNFATWGTEEVTINLKQGMNMLKLVSSTTGGLPNIDLMFVLSPNVTQESCIVTGLKNEAYTTAFFAYPNPFVQSFKINLSKETAYTVFNLTGTEIEHGLASQDIELGNQWSSGVYFVKIDYENRSQFLKIIKK